MGSACLALEPLAQTQQQAGSAHAGATTREPFVQVFTQDSFVQDQFA